MNTHILKKTIKNVLIYDAIAIVISLGISFFLQYDPAGVFIFMGITLLMTTTLVSLNTYRFLVLNEEIHRLNNELKKQATYDPLTNIYNRSFFFERGEQQLLLAKRYNRPLSLLLLDIDYFKKINDNHGHSKGDIVLRDIALLLKAGLRRSDILARYGGEEFILMLPETEKEGALFTAEKIRKEIEALCFCDENEKIFHITSSFGIYVMEENHLSLAEIIHFADMALYKAKKNGRNRVELLGH